MSDADNTARKQQVGRPFQPGQSGNPGGRPKGSLNATTRMVQALLDGDAEDIVRKAIELAKAGDGPVLRAVLERIAPARKDNPVSLDLPPVETAADAKAASSAVLAAVAIGDITPGEGQSVMALLTAHRAIVETQELEARIAALEAKGGK
ncbi:MAG: DUF5681 domain-containing protein [Alphaproteobacteria bacterium]